TIHTYSKETARFGIRHPQGPPDPVFKESSEETWARADYVEVARKLDEKEAEGTSGETGGESAAEPKSATATQTAKEATTETPLPEKTEETAADKAAKADATRELNKIFDEDNK